MVMDVAVAILIRMVIRASEVMVMRVSMSMVMMI